MTPKISAAELDYVHIDRRLVERAVEALDRAKKAGLRVVTAESCTGGLVATVLSEATGAAEYLEGGSLLTLRNRNVLVSNWTRHWWRSSVL